jgi:chondroitin-sulfate-ABC endolyase/exolyase
MIKKNLFFSAFTFLTLASFAQGPIDICENVVPANWVAVNGKLSLSESHFKQGKQSIRWDWNAENANLKIKDKAFENVVSDERSSFVIWVYNEMPTKDSLQFLFKKDNELNCSFAFQLDFKGWRTAWVMYNRDMKGAPKKGMNNLTIISPSSLKKGTLFFDAMQYAVTVDPRAPMRDMQVPFINPGNFDKSANAHWVNLLLFSQLPDYICIPTSISEKEIKEIEIITKVMGRTHTATISPSLVMHKI